MSRWARRAAQIASQLPSSEGENQMTKPRGYRYAALAESMSIRLLRIHFPATDDVEDLQSIADQDIEVRCSLEVTDLNHPPQYWALSYTWGNPEEVADSLSEEHNFRRNLSNKPRKIYIDKAAVSIAANLYDALLIIKKHHTLFWIDAVCINQTNLAERSQQVGLMSRIYHLASRVVVWLGNDLRGDGDLVRDSICQLRNVGMDLQSRIENGGDLHNHQPRNRFLNDFTDESFLRRFQLPAWSRERWINLTIFFKRRWFHRAWCVQEILLARDTDDILIVYGHVVFTWKDLAATSLALAVTGLTRSLAVLAAKPNEPKYSLGQVGQYPMEIQTISKLLTRDPGPHWELVQTLTGATVSGLNASGLLFVLHYLTRTFGASDPRDKIFALLGIVESFMRARQLNLSSIRADYAKSTVEVFHEAAQDILLGTKCLTLLTVVQDERWKQISGLPSWVPDFSAIYHPHPLLLLKPSSPFYNASGCGSSTKATFKIEGESMYLYATKVGSITTKSEACSDMIHWKNGSLVDFANMTMSAPLIYLNGQPRYEALWRTFIGDQDGNSLPASSALGGEFASWLRFLLVRRKLVVQESAAEYSMIVDAVDRLAQSDPSSPIPRASEIRRLIDLCKAAWPSRAAMIRRLVAALPSFDGLENAGSFIVPHRRLFCTTSGHMGLGPESLQEGDTVWIVCGARTPFIFRKACLGENNMYRLVGETYVHGIMQGEALVGGVSSWNQVILI